MKLIKLTLLLFFLLAPAIEHAAWAGHGGGSFGGHGGGSFGGHAGNFAGGHGGGGYHGGYGRGYYRGGYGGLYVDPSFYFYPWAYSGVDPNFYGFDTYPGTVVSPGAPQAYAEQGPSANAGQAYPPPADFRQNNHSNDWYYCLNPAGYYPYVRECPAGWQRVPAQPPAQP